MEFSRSPTLNHFWSSRTSLSNTSPIFSFWGLSCLFLSLITSCAGHTRYHAKCWSCSVKTQLKTAIPRREVGEEESTSEATTTIHPDDIETGPSLGQILGVMTLVIIVFYIFGISWKVKEYMLEHKTSSIIRT